MLGYNVAVLSVEVLAAVIESLKCIISGNITGCARNVVSDTLDGFTNAFSDFANGIVDLGNSLSDSVKNCLLSGNNANYQLLLDSESFSKLDILKSS